MKLILPLCILTAFLFGCEKQNTIKIDCGGNNVEINMSADGEKLATLINGDKLEFNIAISASGARYVAQHSGKEITLWNKGDDWTLYLDAEPPIMCSAK